MERSGRVREVISGPLGRELDAGRNPRGAPTFKVQHPGCSHPASFCRCSETFSIQNIEFDKSLAGHSTSLTIMRGEYHSSRGMSAGECHGRRMPASE